MNNLATIKQNPLQIIEQVKVEDIFIHVSTKYAILRKTLQVEVSDEVITLEQLDLDVEHLPKGETIDNISCPINLFTKNNHKDCASAYASKDNMSTYVKCKCPDCQELNIYYIIESRYGILRNYAQFQKNHILVEGRSGAVFYKTYSDDEEIATIAVMKKEGVKDAWADRTVNIEVLKKSEEQLIKVNVVDIALKGIFNTIPNPKQISNKTDISNFDVYGNSMKRYHNICFKPNKNTSQEYNLWKGFPIIDAYSHDVSPFLSFIYEAIGEEANYVLDYFAHMIQKPEEKPRYCLVFKGSKGVGKNTIEEALGKDLLYTENYYRTSQPEQFFGKFNFHVAQNLLSVMQELKWDNGKNYDSILKDMITETSRSVEQKFMDQVMFDNYSRIVITTNEDWAVPAKGKDERRYCVISFPDKKYALLDEKIKSYYKWKEEFGEEAKMALMNFLKMRDLSEFDIDKAPETKGLIEQMEYSLTGVDKFVYDALHNAYFGKISERNKNNSLGYLEVIKNRIKSADLYGCFQNSFPVDAMNTNSTKFHERMHQLIGTNKIKSNGIHSQFLDINESMHLFKNATGVDINSNINSWYCNWNHLEEDKENLG
ncbi:DUF5906 domain-containing protein [Aliarcobacter cryaerophilus]|uniref:primase-helicase family protein n=1 Tax=Aliarcobacter cryaerophilus TaxID=28198 RepID=UPI003DA2233C